MEHWEVSLLVDGPEDVKGGSDKLGLVKEGSKIVASTVKVELSKPKPNLNSTKPNLS